MAKKTNTPANVNNVTNNTAAALNLANGTKYTPAAAVDVETAAAAVTAAAAIETAAKEAFVNAGSSLREARTATAAATLDAAAARYAAGVATAGDIVLLADDIAANHAAAAVVESFADMCTILEGDECRKAWRAFLSESVTAGAAFRALRENEKAAAFFAAAGVDVDKKALTPAYIRPHALNAFAVAAKGGQTFAALPNKAGKLVPVTSWTAEKAAKIVLWNTLCNEQMPAALCEERRALLAQVDTAAAAFKAAQKEERAARAKEERAAAAAAALPEYMTEERAAADERTKEAKRTRRAAAKGAQVAKRTARTAAANVDNTAPAAVHVEAKKRTRRASKKTA